MYAIRSYYANELQNSRAEYGKQIIVTLSRELVERFGKNYEEKNLRRMIQFAKQFPDAEKVVTLSRHLSWSHFLALIPLKSEAVITSYSIHYTKLYDDLGRRVQPLDAAQDLDAVHAA